MITCNLQLTDFPNFAANSESNARCVFVIALCLILTITCHSMIIYNLTIIVIIINMDINKQLTNRELTTRKQATRNSQISLSSNLEDLESGNNFSKTKSPLFES